MATSFAGRKRLRKNFGRLMTAVEMPNLIEVQKSSYEAFLQRNIPVEERTSTGLQEVFQSVFPIHDFAERGTIEEIAGFTRAIGETAKILGLPENGYRTVTNIGRHGLQEVPHLHTHIFGGKRLGTMLKLNN